MPRGVGVALAAGVAIGVFYLALARTAAESGLWPLVAARLVSIALCAAMAVAAARSLRADAGSLRLIVAAGVLDMSANALYLLAARSGPLSVVVTLASLYPASTVLLARLALGERLSVPQWLGVGCAMAAVVLIVGSA
jgi:drug/metabolite transporter (DMT)-like permease